MIYPYEKGYTTLTYIVGPLAPACCASTASRLLKSFEPISRHHRQRRNIFSFHSNLDHDHDQARPGKCSSSEEGSTIHRHQDGPPRRKKVSTVLSFSALPSSTSTNYGIHQSIALHFIAFSNIHTYIYGTLDRIETWLRGMRV